MVLNLALFWISVLKLIACQDISDYKRLYDDLFLEYNRELTPFPNGSKSISVSTSFMNFGINSFNEVDGIISVFGSLNLSWIDSSLMWNPSKYNGITTLRLDQSTVWCPDVILWNDAFKLATVGSDTMFRVAINYEGHVNWIPGGIMKAKCPANIRKFPFDNHTCALKFVVFDFPTPILLEPSYIPYEGKFTPKNKDWSIEYAYVKENSPKIKFSFEVYLHIKREPLYYNVLIFSPIAVLSMMNPLVFILPNDNGERVSFGMTILLSFIVFLTVVSDVIPATSDPISFLIIFIVMQFVTSAVISVCNIAIIRISHRKEAKIGKWTDFLLRKCTRKENKTCDYKDLASGLDKICFVLSYITMCILFSVYFTVMTTN